MPFFLCVLISGDAFSRSAAAYFVSRLFLQFMDSRKHGTHNKRPCSHRTEFFPCAFRAETAPWPRVREAVARHYALALASSTRRRLSRLLSDTISWSSCKCVCVCVYCPRLGCKVGQQILYNRAERRVRRALHREVQCGVGKYVPLCRKPCGCALCKAAGVLEMAALTISRPDFRCSVAGTNGSEYNITILLHVLRYIPQGHAVLGHGSRKDLCVLLQIRVNPLSRMPADRQGS